MSQLQKRLELESKVCSNKQYLQSHFRSISHDRQSIEILTSPLNAAHNTLNSPSVISRQNVHEFIFPGAAATSSCQTTVVNRGGMKLVNTGHMDMKRTPDTLKATSKVVEQK